MFQKIETKVLYFELETSLRHFMKLAPDIPDIRWLGHKRRLVFWKDLDHVLIKNIPNFQKYNFHCIFKDIWLSG